MPKVWAVSEGYYSAKSIIALFYSAEEAEKYLLAANDDYNDVLEAYELYSSADECLEHDRLERERARKWREEQRRLRALKPE